MPSFFCTYNPFERKAVLPSSSPIHPISAHPTLTRLSSSKVLTKMLSTVSAVAERTYSAVAVDVFVSASMVSSTFPSASFHVIVPISVDFITSFIRYFNLNAQMARRYTRVCTRSLAERSSPDKGYTRTTCFVP